MVYNVNQNIEEYENLKNNNSKENKKVDTVDSSSEILNVIETIEKNVNNHNSSNEIDKCDESAEIKSNNIDEETLKLIEALEIEKKFKIPYIGYKEDDLYRILMISHGGFIMEFLNALRLLKKQKLRYMNDSYNTSLYVIKIYCGKCGNNCKMVKDCRLEYEFILMNDYTHLDEMK